MNEVRRVRKGIGGEEDILYNIHTADGSCSTLVDVYRRMSLPSQAKMVWS
jgi:hypothetical protein